jgi:hypothetical protein
MDAPDSNPELVLQEGWARLWQPGISPKGFHLYLAYAGEGRFLLTTRRLVWFRWYPGGLKNGRYSRAIYPATRVLSGDLLEFGLNSFHALAQRTWTDSDGVQVLRVNISAGEHELAVVCVDSQTRQPVDTQTRTFGLHLVEHTRALNMTA